MSNDDKIRQQVKDLAEEIQMRDNIDPYIAKLRAWKEMVDQAMSYADEAGIF